MAHLQLDSSDTPQADHPGPSVLSSVMSVSSVPPTLVVNAASITVLCLQERRIIMAKMRRHPAALQVLHDTRILPSFAGMQYRATRM
ncbi:hypothetical protein PoB_001981400 [Plakobranchus ocellatus]|uniref:Uncharacterized protein n=1 Tax=Plakobranchus ocellatus TaxID=259542 RepID=A0AAV3ZHE2_9GAST|nr:hypothetical protein PoB_001981400 [Plakobranchus ocellatus]